MEQSYMQGSIKIVPCLYSMLFGSAFSKLYKQTQVAYSTSLEKAIHNSNKLGKPCLLILSPNHHHPQIQQLLSADSMDFVSDGAIQNRLFEVVGIVQNVDTNRKFQQSAPYLYFIRKNITDQVEIIYKCGIHDRHSRLNSIVDEFQRGRKGMKESQQGIETVLRQYHWRTIPTSQLINIKPLGWFCKAIKRKLLFDNYDDDQNYLQYVML